MDREEELGMMAQGDLCFAQGIRCADCVKKGKPCDVYVIMARMYDRGYRFADEVRKETAKEIYERVDKWLDEIVLHAREETILICLLGWIKTKFGIEVGE